MIVVEVVMFDCEKRKMVVSVRCCLICENETLALYYLKEDVAE